MGQYKHYKGNVGGGVDISHKSKMSGKAKNQMSFPGGMPGPGDYGKMEQAAKIVGKGMARYLAGESVGMRKMDPMYNGKSGVQQDDFEQFGAPKSTGPAKYTRLDKTKAKAKDAKIAADKANDGSSNASLDKMNKTKAKAERLAKRQKRQEGRAERKNIRKKAKQGKIIEGESGEYNAMSKKQKIKASRQKQNKSEGPAKTKKYIQDKEGKIEGTAVRIIGSGSGKVLASRDKKEVGKKYKK